ncbi:MAG: prepilin-type N-terminal cleavage/methylation domain-containing protein [Alphaproteobacteria bacterium]
MKYSSKGFTLLELSIVLIIIGLIISGVTVGNELINQTRTKTIIIELKDIETATNNFTTLYNYLPGDFPQAGKLWTSATCANSAAPTGCNGNGDGQINIDVTLTLTGSEVYRVWQHLSLAGLLSGSYTGTNNKLDQYPSRYPNNLYTMRYTNAFSGASNFNVIEIGSWSANTSGYLLASSGSLTPADANNLDKKLDDGYANSGKLLGIDGDNVSNNSCSYPYSLAGGLKTYNINGNQGQFCKLQKILE